MIAFPRRLSPKTLLLVWLSALGLLSAVLFPITLATGALLLMVGLAVPAVMVLLGKDQQPQTVAQVINHAERSATTQ